MPDKICKIQDLNNLNTDELVRLAAEIREFLVGTVSRTGGHLAANLGVVELTIALCMEFDPYKDKIVWDVGHQAYVYKILTGRAERFDTLRKLDGLSGFPKRSESAADAFNTGHSSTSISAAAGFAAAARLNGDDYRSVAVVGDGALTGGMAFEALNHIGSSKLPVIVVMNDNGMSISKNVGGLSKRLKRLRSTGRYFKLKSDVKSALDRVPIAGKFLKKFIRNIKRVIKKLLLPSNIFEDIGFKYLGPIDGHSIKDLRAAFIQAKEMTEPVIIHVNTKKGKGYLPAEKSPDYFHGVGRFDEKTGRIAEQNNDTWSDCFGSKLCDMAGKNKNIVAITAAMPQGTGLSEFAAKYPDRFFDVAIAEQHAVTFAAGLAAAGLTPVVAVYSTFLQRAYDQIIHDAALMNLHVVFGIDRCGPVGSDGETHQGVYDIAYMTQIPNMTVLSPSDSEDFERMLEYAVCDMKTPVAVRYPRGAVRTDCAKEAEGPTAARLLREGTDVLIAAVGISVCDALKAADILKSDGISAAVADVRCVKPIDREFMISNASGKSAVVSVEDGIGTGGFGQQLECLLGREVLRFAYPDEPIVQGTVDEIKHKYGLDGDSIAEAIKDYLRNRIKR